MQCAYDHQGPHTCSASCSPDLAARATTAADLPASGNTATTVAAVPLPFLFHEQWQIPTAMEDLAASSPASPPPFFASVASAGLSPPTPFSQR
uniref:Uncharacterized protein n=1 Tax=Oryza sativa subsp. japonica TaxID=39947 RepID=Q8LNH4_ORYSJ|nr:hypothetical protein [Oryza sativa Japonica Group]